MIFCTPQLAPALKMVLLIISQLKEIPAES
jgi:hypothetical protein